MSVQELTEGTLWRNWYILWNLINDEPEGKGIERVRAQARTLLVEAMRRGEKVAGDDALPNPIAINDLLVRHGILMDVILADDTDHTEEATRFCREIVEKLLERGVKIPEQRVELRLISSNPKVAPARAVAE